jgi:hypothetical protein
MSVYKPKVALSWSPRRAPRGKEGHDGHAAPNPCLSVREERGGREGAGPQVTARILEWYLALACRDSLLVHLSIGFGFVLTRTSCSGWLTSNHACATFCESVQVWMCWGLEGGGAVTLKVSVRPCKAIALSRASLGTQKEPRPLSLQAQPHHFCTRSQGSKSSQNTAQKKSAAPMILPQSTDLFAYM